MDREVIHHTATMRPSSTGTSPRTGQARSLDLQSSQIHPLVFYEEKGNHNKGEETEGVTLTEQSPPKP